MTPQFLSGENDVIVKRLRTYLIADGRSTGVGGDSGGPSLLPAEGAIYVTTYRVIFIGIPCDALGWLMTSSSRVYSSCYLLQHLIKLWFDLFRFPVCLKRRIFIQMTSISIQISPETYKLVDLHLLLIFIFFQSSSSSSSHLHLHLFPIFIFL